MKTCTAQITGTVDQRTRFIGAMLSVALMLPSIAVSQSPSPVNLRTAGDFAVLSSAGVTNTGATVITGDLGVSPGSSITGSPAVIGVIHVGDEIAIQAQLDLTVAYNDVAGRTLNVITIAGNIGGQTLYPGLYKSTSSLAISSGDLTLDAQGDANAVFIFQIASTLTTTSDRKVILSGGARPANIFWQVGSSATLGTYSVFKGNIMVYASITMTTGAALEGRVLAQGGAITLDANVITKPSNTNFVEIGVTPQKFALFQNYPNPFNPSTAIAFGLPQRALVRLTVYNTLGEQVVELSNGEMEAGYHEVKFDGGTISSGVYFYRMEAGSFVQTRKLLLIR